MSRLLVRSRSAVPASLPANAVTANIHTTASPAHQQQAESAFTQQRLWQQQHEAKIRIVEEKIKDVESKLETERDSVKFEMVESVGYTVCIVVLMGSLFGTFRTTNIYVDRSDHVDECGSQS